MFRATTFLTVIIQTAILVMPAFADQVVLKNGDRLTGKIVKMDGEKITVETDAAGKVDILWTAVARIASDDELFIELADGRKISGAVSPSDSGLRVRTAPDETVSVSGEEIRLIRSAGEQAAYEASIVRQTDRSIFSHWTGSADVGFSLTAGNSKTRSLNFGTKGVRQTADDRISLYAKGVQASNSTTGTSVTTAQAFWFGGRYERNLNERTFVFVTADFEYDKPQQLNLRTVAGGGFGYKWIRSERTELDIFGGATFNREYFEGADNRSSAEALAGEELRFQITDSTILEQKFSVYPNLSRPGTFRATFDATAVTSLNSWLGWQVSLGNRYNSDPVPGARSNDLLFSTGLRATFGGKKD